MSLLPRRLYAQILLLVALILVGGCGTGATPEKTRDRSALTTTAAKPTFVCQADAFGNRRCYAPTGPGALAQWDLKDSTLTERAWCFESPARGDFYDRSCFQSLADCRSRARLDLFSVGPCIDLDARTYLVSVYGSDVQ